MGIKDLIGKTISDAELLKTPAYDDEGWLRLRFTDGTKAIIVSSYGMYTGSSYDEYPTYIEVNDDDDGLVPVEA